MLRSSRKQLLIGMVILLGGLALMQHWLASRRPGSEWFRAGQEFLVTNSADRGTGSLREAIFAADSARQRARILVRTDTVVLSSPLPPLVNPFGVIVQADGRNTVIDATNIGVAPVFDVAAPYSVISNLEIRNAPEQAVLVRKDGLRILNVGMTNGDVGLYVADGVSDVITENSRFDRNRIGILLASENSGIVLRNNKFSAHKDAAVWAVQRDQPGAPSYANAELKGNHFEGDRLAIVLGNFPALVEGNEFVKAQEAALYLIGKGAIVRGNRIRNGAGNGVFAHGTQGVIIEGNELDHNQALAVLVRSSQDAVVQGNRLYNNGYGLAFVLGQRNRPSMAADNTMLAQQFDGIILIGDSPIIQGNRMLNNTLAGLRVLDFLPLDGSRIASEPFLGNNTSQGNKLNQTIRGDYRVQKPE